MENDNEIISVRDGQSISKLLSGCNIKETKKSYVVQTEKDTFYISKKQTQITRNTNSELLSMRFDDVLKKCLALVYIKNETNEKVRQNKIAKVFQYKRDIQINTNIRYFLYGIIYLHIKKRL